MKRLCLQTLFRERCLEEIKIISTLTYNESDVLSSVNKTKDKFEQLLIHHKNRVSTLYLIV